MDKLCLIVVLGFAHVVTGEGRTHYVLNGGWNDIICKSVWIVMKSDGILI